KRETRSPASALSHSARLPSSHCVSASARWLTQLVGWWHDRNRHLCRRDPSNRVGHTGRALCRRAQRRRTRSGNRIAGTAHGTSNNSAPVGSGAEMGSGPFFAVVHPTLKLLSIKTNRCSGGTIVTEKPVMSRAAILATVITGILEFLSPCRAATDAEIVSL